MNSASSKRRPSKPPRRGYSLIEMILATAVLAASGLALQTLLAQASRLALRSEQQTMALQLAETLIDETIAIPPQDDRTMETTFAHDDRWSYRLQIEAVSDIRMSRITAEVFFGENGKSNLTNTEQEPLCRLVRWVRTSQIESKRPSSNPLPADRPSSMENRRR